MYPRKIRGREHEHGNANISKARMIAVASSDSWSGPNLYTRRVTESQSHTFHLRTDYLHFDSDDLHFEGNVEIILPDPEVQVEHHIKVRSDDGSD